MEFSRKELSSMVRLAVTMASADGKIVKEETSLIAMEMATFGVDALTFSQIMKEANNNNVGDTFQTISEMGDEKKKYVAGLLSVIIVADGVIEESEVKMWNLVSLLAQLPPMTLPEAIAFWSKKNYQEEENEIELEPFSFTSTYHQRYEQDIPKMGVQHRVRTVSVEKNTEGCKGYKLNPGIGYIVKIFNDELNQPNMTDKPMKVIRKTRDCVELRGFPIDALGPFGWLEVDNSDYGLVVHYENGIVVKCVLYMYDRGIRIEYCK